MRRVDEPLGVGLRVPDVQFRRDIRAEVGGCLGEPLARLLAQVPDVPGVDRHAAVVRLGGQHHDDLEGALGRGRDAVRERERIGAGLVGGVADDISNVVKTFQKQLPRGTQMHIRGQVETMESSYSGLLIGLAMSIVLVYLLIVVNFQSWLDPFIIITALPGALAGILWILFLTHTTLSVPALTGAVMCMGVATANSILLISFARERMAEGHDAIRSAVEAGYTRMRPVIMTALAMIMGMLPMALGFGEGGEQNAPLGRAVIGGLLVATVATLFFVPVVFSIFHGRRMKSAPSTLAAQS